MSDKIVVGRGDPEIRELLDAVLEQDYPGFIQAATRDKIDELAVRQIDQYRLRLDSQLTLVNVEETERLLDVWLATRGKEFSELSDEAKLEVLDALAAERLP